MLTNQNDAKIIAKANRKIQYNIFVGTNDAIFPLQEVRKTTNYLNALNFPTELSIIKKHNHWYYDIGPFISEKAWQFFDKHQKN
jgi:dipeptidyl aminopeptidase/acylaminoacyl peptidase